MKPTIFPPTEKIDFSKKLNVKFGIDPTSDKLHLGHLIPLLQVKKLLKEGHHIDIVLGTFTAQLGDPSGKDTMRPILDEDTTINNAHGILAQVTRVLGSFNFKVSLNHTWFESMSSIKMINLLSRFTTTQLLSRDSFQKRIAENNPLGIHELIVPVLQGLDSVQLKTDVEIGGTDQMFNFGITRDVQKIYGQTPEICMLMPIINGTDGRKMSKSFNNCIFINDTPEDVFGKTMSISDEMMKEWWPVFSDFPLNMQEPMNMKKKLAFEITKEIWSMQDALDAMEHFEKVIQNKKLPSEIKEVQGGFILDIVKELRSCSRNEATRLMKAGAVTVDGLKVLNPETRAVGSGMVVKVGKRDFAKII